MNPIAPKDIRYIKLGEGGRWADRCIERGEVPFDYHLIPHDVCLREDWRAVGEYLHEAYGLDGRELTNAVREIRDFYTLGSDCLWITFAQGHLWWTFAHPEVEWVGPNQEEGPPRRRKAVGRWEKLNIKGEPLQIDRLSTRLTQVANYRMTICQVKAPEYAIRRINGEEEPIVTRGRLAQNVLVSIAADMIADLHWGDFETLVDLIFSRSGWQRISRVGGSMKDVDILLQQPATGERAFVQVKSSARQAVLDDYVERFRSNGTFDRMFFVCHSPQGALRANASERVHVWSGELLATAAVKAGLFDWLTDQSL